MKLITQEIREQLLKNGRESRAAIERDGDTPDHAPVLKLFFPAGAYTALFTEMDEDGILFGLSDHGVGTPELGSVSLEEIEAFNADRKRRGGLQIERDLYFKAAYSLSVYTEAAQKLGRITENSADFAHAGAPVSHDNGEVVAPAP